MQILLIKAMNAQNSHTVIMFRPVMDSLHPVEVLNSTIYLIHSHTSIYVSQGYLLPVLIGDKIENPGDNEIWQLALQLREIVELICAPVFQLVR